MEALFRMGIPTVLYVYMPTCISLWVLPYLKHLEWSSTHGITCPEWHCVCGRGDLHYSALISDLSLWLACMDHVLHILC